MVVGPHLAGLGPDGRIPCARLGGNLQRTHACMLSNNQAERGGLRSGCLPASHALNDLRSCKPGGIRCTCLPLGTRCRPRQSSPTDCGPAPPAGTCLTRDSHICRLYLGSTHSLEQLASRRPTSVGSACLTCTHHFSVAGSLPRDSGSKPKFPGASAKSPSCRAAHKYVHGSSTCPQRH